MSKRWALVTRTTKETDIKLTLNLDGEGKVKVDTGIGFADHMLTLFAFWAGFDLDLTCKGDLVIDSHHSLEDIGLCLGQALAEALGDKQGITRVANAKVPHGRGPGRGCRGPVRPSLHRVRRYPPARHHRG